MTNLNCAAEFFLPGPSRQFFSVITIRFVITEFITIPRLWSKLPAFPAIDIIAVQFQYTDKTSEVAILTIVTTRPVPLAPQF